MAHVEQGGLCWAYICSLMADDGNGYVNMNMTGNRTGISRLNSMHVSKIARPLILAEEIQTTCSS